MKKTLLLLFAMFMAMLSFAQSSNLKNTITPAAGETWWGYFTEDDVNASNYGATVWVNKPTMRLPLKF